MSLTPLKIDAQVTVKPGTVFKFKADVGFTIKENGSLNATGTADKPIIFTATDETPGYWYGLYFKSRSSNNRLNHVKVLYAGSATIGHNGHTMHRPGGDTNPPSRAVWVGKEALLSMADSVMAYSDGYGVEVLGELGTCANNTIKHSEIPLRLQIDAVGRVAATNRFSDNNKAQIDVIGNSTLDHDATWQDLGIPYNIRYFNTIAANLKLQPGVVFKMGDGAELVVNGQGSLYAVGTADDPIVIEGWNDAPGYWTMLEFSSRSNKNVLGHVRVSDGGGGSPHHADILVPNHGRLSVTHSVVANSKGYGVVVLGNLGKFSHNVFKNNHAPMHVQANAVGHVDNTNQFTGNDEHQIVVEAAPGTSLETASVWQDLGIPYFLRFGMDIQAPLTLKPGVVLRLGKGADLGVDAKGSLHAVGTAGKPIVIHGKSKQPGYWSSVHIQSRSQNNAMKYVKIAGGGGGKGPLFEANIYVGGYLELEHSRIENSANYGVYVDEKGRLVSSHNTFKNNKVDKKVID